MATRRHSPLKIKSTEAHQCTLSTRLHILSQVPFFQDLSVNDLEKVNALFHEKGFETGEVICFAGDPARQIFVVAEGRVKLTQHALTGKNILLDMLTPGEFFGRYSRDEGALNIETAQAQTKSCVLVINREDFQGVLNQYPLAALRVIDIMAERLQTAHERVHQLSAMAVDARIASVLLTLSKKFGEKRRGSLLIQVPLTREDLSEMAGTTIESASRVMSDLRKNGLIHSGRGWVAVVDTAGLQELTKI